MAVAVEAQSPSFRVDLEVLLRRCTVRILTPAGCGTGFFIAPQTILTCGHVVSREGVNGVVAYWYGSENPSNVEIPCTVTKVLPNPCPETGGFPDIALLTFQQSEINHPCVLPGIETAALDPLYIFGYPSEKPFGDEMRGYYEGLSEYGAAPNQKLLKIRETQVLPGASGSPVLNLRTGRVCGMIKRTRDQRLDLGGMAVSMASIFQSFPSLERGGDSANQNWLELIRSLVANPLPRPVLNLAPQAPAHSVERAVEYMHLKARITAHTGAVAVCAVQGMGGVGKTTLALQLAHDPAMTRMFPDGVLWTTLSNDTPPVDALKSWIRLLEKTESAARSVATAAAEFRALLNTRRCLIVVDNVLRREDVEHFMPPNEQSCLLFTTRRQVIAGELGIDAISLDVMPEDLALSVVEKTLGRALTGDERREAARVVDLVGRLPLALPMLSERVRTGKTWSALAAALSAEIKRIEALEPAGGLGQPDTRIEACFRITVDEVQQRSSVAYSSFCRLGLLPAGLTFSAAMTATVMGLDNDTAAEVLEYLLNEGLLTRGGTDVGERAVLRMHDLIHGFARRILSKRSPALLAREHGELLQRYRDKCTGSGWHTLIPDGYIHSRLLWHFEQAGQAAAIQDVLHESAADGRNGWFAACERLGNIDNYLRDIESAWQRCEQDDRKNVDSGQSPPYFAIEIERALQRSSVYSRDADYPPAILAALLRLNIWSLPQIMAEIARYADPALRVSALITLAHECGDPDRARGILAQAVATVPLLRSDDFVGGLQEHLARALLRAGMLNAVQELISEQPVPARGPIVENLIEAAVSDEELMMLNELLRDADPGTRLMCLMLSAARAGPARPQFVSEAQLLMHTNREWYLSDYAISYLSTMPEGHDRELFLDQVLTRLDAIRNQQMAQSVLTSIAPLLNDTQRAHALERARKLIYHDAEIALLARLDRETRAESVRALLTGLGEEMLTVRTFRAYVLIAASLPEWKDQAFRSALAVLPHLSATYDLAEGIKMLAPVVAEFDFASLIALAVRIPSVYERFAALQALADRNAGLLSQRPFAGLSEGLDEGDAIYLAAHLAPLYAEPDRSRLLSSCTRYAKHGLFTNDIRLAILPHLENPEERRSVFESLVRDLGEGTTWSDTKAFVRLARICPEDLLDDFLRTAMRCPNLELRLAALSALAPRLNSDQMRYIFSSLRVIGDGEAASGSIAALETEIPADGAVFCPTLRLPLLSVMRLAKLLRERSRGFESQGLRVIVNALAGAGHTDEALQFLPYHHFGMDEDSSYAQTVLDLAGVVDFRSLWAAVRRKDVPEILEPLLRVAPEPERTELALGAWRKAQGTNVWEEACAVYARFLPDPEQRAALDVAIECALDSEGEWSSMCPYVCPWMEPAQLEKLARRFHRSESKLSRAAGLLGLAPFRGDKGFEEALDALSPLDKPERVEVVSSQVRRFEGEQARTLRYKGLMAARSLAEQYLRAEALILVAAQLDNPERDEVVVESAEAACNAESDRLHILTGLTPHLCRLAPKTLYEVLERVLRTGSRRQRRALLDDIAALRFAICSLAGPGVAREVRDVIAIVHAWWP